ncbi:MAG: sugar ABC transporter permease [Peptoniphilus sp.]|nr:sugar ABC transporter permease [Peptoniphilus sp.]
MKKNKITIRQFIEKQAHFFYTIPAVTLYIIFMMIPFVRGIFFSFTDWNGIAKNFNIIGLENFVDLMRDQRILGSLSFTVRYTIVLMIGTTIIALCLAILLNRKMKLRGLVRTVYFFPAVLSMIVIGLIFNQIFLHVLPQIGEILNIEFLSHNILANETGAFWGLLFVNLWQGLAIPTVLFLAGLQSVPAELIDAAAIDGANSWKRFWNIKFPYLIPAMNMVIILSLKAGLTSFDHIMAITQGGPNKATESVGLLIYRYAFTEFKFSYANALAVVLFILIGIVSLIQVKGMNKYEVSE